MSLFVHSEKGGKVPFFLSLLKAGSENVPVCAVLTPGDVGASCGLALMAARI